MRRLGDGAPGSAGSADAGTPVFSPASPSLGTSSHPTVIHSTPMLPGQLASHHSQGTPIRGTHAARPPRGDLGRTPNRAANKDLRVVPLTPMDEFGESQQTLPFPRSIANGDQNEYTDSAMDADDAELIADIDANEAVRAEAQIWGTDISVQNCINVFRLFLESFRLQSSDPVPHYSQIFLQMQASGGRVLNLDCQHVRAFPTTRVFYDQLVRYPQEIVPLLDRVASEEYRHAIRRYGDRGALVDMDEELEATILQVRPCNLAQKCRLRDLDPDHIDSLVSLHGMVLRCSAVIPDLKVALFRCAVCGHIVESGLDRGRIEEPTSCPQCQAAGAMDLLHNRCAFSDKQLIRLQETPDEIPAGETPCTVTLFTFDDLVDSVRPGDRVQVTGIFRAVMKRVNPRQRNVQSVFKTYVDAIHFQSLHVQPRNAAAGDDAEGEPEELATVEDVDFNQPQGSEDADLPIFGEEQVQAFRQFAALPNAYDELVRLFAPSVYGLEDVKKGLLCLLFGGTVRNRVYYAARREQDRDRHDDFAAEGEGAQGSDEQAEELSERVHLRGDLNILLCGDPGTSKSQLLGYVHRLSSRGIYTSGKGSSAVGLTASVVRDVETREMVLESGALVLSDQGICCIDEFDKMSEQTRAILHEAMEQQTVSITKAGIIATLHARTSILASANPAQSRYNPKLSVLENIQLPPTLISRFDLIYLVLDKPDKEQDRRLARHLVSLYHSCGDGPADDEEPTSPELKEGQVFLRNYILYARNYVFPEISDEAEPVLAQAYLQMRSLGSAHFAANLSDSAPGASSAATATGMSGRRQHNITATPRQLESLIRLSQALAKMRLSPDVRAEDVREAVRLVKVATHTAAIDPRTGTIDMDILSTGRGSVDRGLTAQLAQHIMDTVLAQHRGDRITVGQIRQQLLQGARQQRTLHGPSAAQVTMAQVEAAARELHAQGLLQYMEGAQTCVLRSA